ncbi:glycosyltransferase [Falsiroseomonas sp. HW251]|uniref:glycosyltransferase n=1 Tax=Falsiroseomonas sp. HW251 TaxID=3390998 RepID=UPI003D31198B
MAEPAICILSHSHPAFSKGGGELAAHRQTEALRSTGRRAIFVAANEVGTAYAAQRPIETVMRFATDEWVYSFAGMAKDLLGWDDAWQRRQVVDFLAGLDVGVYHLHHYWRVGLDLIADLMEARPDARFVMSLHEMLAICIRDGQMLKTRGRELCRQESPLECLACFPQETLERLAFRKAAMLSVLRRFDHLVYPSAFIRGRYEAWGLAGRPASVIENYLGEAAMAEPRAAGDAAVLAQRFGYFGTATPYKGLDILLRALPLARRANPAITVTVFGAEASDTIKMFPELEPLIAEAGPSLTFAGRYDSADAIALMRDVGWVVVPSIWWENSPVVIQEAKRAGTPLIVADIGGMAEKVENGVDGLHFRRASPVDLARAMAEAADPARRAALATSLRDTTGRETFLRALDRAFAPPQPDARAAE